MINLDSVNEASLPYVETQSFLLIKYLLAMNGEFVVAAQPPRSTFRGHQRPVPNVEDLFLPSCFRIKESYRNRTAKCFLQKSLLTVHSRKQHVNHCKPMIFNFTPFTAVFEHVGPELRLLFFFSVMFLCLRWLRSCRELSEVIH